MLPRLYNRFFIDFTIDSSFIDSTIDSSLNLQLILHWHYNQFVLKPSLIPFNSSWCISEYFIHFSLTLHQFLFNYSPIFFVLTLHQFLLSNFHQLFVNSSFICLSILHAPYGFHPSHQSPTYQPFFCGLLVIYGSLILRFAARLILYIPIDSTYINWHFYLLFQTSVNVFVTYEYQDPPTIAVRI